MFLFLPQTHNSNLHKTQNSNSHSLISYDWSEQHFNMLLKSSLAEGLARSEQMLRIRVKVHTWHQGKLISKMSQKWKGDRVELHFGKRILFTSTVSGTRRSRFNLYSQQKSFAHPNVRLYILEHFKFLDNFALRVWSLEHWLIGVTLAAHKTANGKLANKTREKHALRESTPAVCSRNSERHFSCVPREFQDSTVTIQVKVHSTAHRT